MPPNHFIQRVRSTDAQNRDLLESTFMELHMFDRFSRVDGLQLFHLDPTFMPEPRVGRGSASCAERECHGSTTTTQQRLGDSSLRSSVNLSMEISFLPDVMEWFLLDRFGNLPGSAEKVAPAPAVFCHISQTYFLVAERSCDVLLDTFGVTCPNLGPRRGLGCGVVQQTQLQLAWLPARWF